jgi:hypothetical protein
MQSRSINDYVYLGTLIRYLQDAEVGWNVHGEGNVQFDIDAMLTSFETFQLVITLRMAHSELDDFNAELVKSAPDATLSEDHVRRLTAAIELVTKGLYAEGSGNLAYIVRDKRYDVNKLLSDVVRLFGNEVFNRLPELAQIDFRSAGQCIAFELPTSAAFHCLRATEGVLRHLYCHLVKRNRCDLMWGPMVQSLRSKQRLRLPEQLLSDLDNLRKWFRNPTQHPEKLYDIDEAQDLFARSIDVVNQMARLFS